MKTHWPAFLTSRVIPVALAALTLGPVPPDSRAEGAQDDLNVQLHPDGIRLDWKSDGILEFSNSPSGPWKPVDPAVPQVAKGALLPLDADHRFFRVRERDGSHGAIVPLLSGLPPNPPQFGSVELGAFDGQSVRVRAELKPGEVAPPVLPYFLDDTLVLLRDDGMDGDETAGDRRFAGAVPVSLEELTRARSFLGGLSPAAAVGAEFDGRELVEGAAAPDLGVSKAKIDDLLGGRPISLPLPLGVSPTLLSKLPSVPGGITPCYQLPTWQKCLLITDLSVVEDPTRTFDPCTGAGTPMAPWTFGRLMTDLANSPVSGIDASDFARRWLRSWEVAQSINHDPVPARKPGMAATILRAWQEVSGGADKPLSMARAPFRLIAIVNRLDLRGNFTYGGTIGDDRCHPACTTGEGRFIFCFCDPTDPNGGGPYPGGGGPDGNDDDLIGGGREFLVIFEFCVPKRTCRELHAYGQAWANLQCIPFGPDYNAALERITNQFATANAAPGHPNNSALNQLRTNENLLDPLWELREFKIFHTDSDHGHLRPVTVKQTPREDSDATRLLYHYITTTLPAPPDHTVPLEWGVLPNGPQQPFLGGRAVMAPISVTSGSPAWATTGFPAPNMVRHHFALNTCNGCHSTETNTRFTHVGCRAPGQRAPLSGFLVGDGAGGPFVVSIPGSPAASVRFFDLARREKDLIHFLLTPCGFQIFDGGLRAVH